MTAELLLNLAWLAIATAAGVRLALWLRRAPAQARKWTVVIATACVVALLFPIISVTDDLSNDATVIEETQAIRRTLAFVTVVVVAAIVVDVAPLLRSFLLQLALLTVVAVAAAVTRPGFATLYSFRGPPTALLAA